MIFPSDAIEAAIIDTKALAIVLLSDKKDWSTVQRFGGPNETEIDMFFNK